MVAPKFNGSSPNEKGDILGGALKEMFKGINSFCCKEFNQTQIKLNEKANFESSES